MVEEDDSSVEVLPLQVRLKIRKGKQQRSILQGDESDFCSSESDSSSSSSVAREGKGAAMNRRDVSNKENLSNKFLRQNLPKSFPKPPPSTSSTSSHWYCTQILATPSKPASSALATRDGVAPVTQTKENPTRQEYNCACCRLSDGAKQCMTEGKEPRINEEDDLSDAEQANTIVVRDCSPTASTNLYTTSWNDHSWKKKLARHFIEGSSSSDSESEDKELEAKEQKSKKPSQPSNFIDLCDSSSSSDRDTDHDDSFRPMLENMTKKNHNIVVSANSRKLTFTRVKRPKRSIRRQHKKTASLVDLMAKIEIQDGKSNKTPSPRRRKRLPRTSARKSRSSVRRLDDLHFSPDKRDDSSFTDSYANIKNSTVDDGTYDSSFVVNSSDDDDNDDDGISIRSDDSLSLESEEPTATCNKQNPTDANDRAKNPMLGKSPAGSTSTKRKTVKQVSTKLNKKITPKNREELGQKTFERFNRVAFDGKLASVGLVWSKKLNKTAGITRMATVSRGTKVVRREASIELATKIIDNIDRLEATLLHEMCHAADWMIDNNPKPAHGAGFKRWANHSMKRIPGVIVTTKHTYEIAYKYAWACINANCAVVIKRHSRSVDVNKQCCGRCKGKLVEIEAPTPGISSLSSNNGQVRRGVGHTPKKKAAPSAYNLFIKANSKKVKERLTQQRLAEGNTSKVPQGDVMKECARLWKEQKSKM